MIPSLSSLVPNVDDLLTLEVEELAGVLLIYLNDNEDTLKNQGEFNYNNFFNAPNRRDHESRQPEVDRALLEALAWLRSAGLLVEKASVMGNWFFISRRGRQVISRDDFAAYRKAGLLPKHQLHALIAAKVYPAFMRGEYDTAVFQALREVEVAVRNAGQFGPNDYGTDLMRDAFRPALKKDSLFNLAHSQIHSYRSQNRKQWPICLPGQLAFIKTPKVTDTCRATQRTRPK